MSIINEAVEAVIGLINAMDLFADATRGALPTGSGIVCEVGASSPEQVYLDKNKYIPLDLTLNAKHGNLQTLSNAMNQIHEGLTYRKAYPSGTNWEIVDITTTTEPQIIGREPNNDWIMASSLAVKILTKK